MILIHTHKLPYGPPNYCCCWNIKEDILLPSQCLLIKPWPQWERYRYAVYCKAFPTCYYRDNNLESFILMIIFWWIFITICPSPLFTGQTKYTFIHIISMTSLSIMKCHWDFCNLFNKCIFCVQLICIQAAWPIDLTFDSEHSDSISKLYQRIYE